MRSVLADLALESEAALLLAMRLAAAFECDEPGATPAPSDDDIALARAWKRIMTPAAKFWVCKRCIELAGEAMEILGGNGYIDSGIMARLYREAPVNSIWEGSGNVMCLDVIRAIEREPAAWELLCADLRVDGGGSGAGSSAAARGMVEDLRLHECWAELREALAAPPEARQALGRRITERLVLAAQAALMRRHAPEPVAEAFVASRLGARRGRIAGALDPRAVDVEALLERAFPR
jgi:putative acyl-CoA dehydrogenase